MKPIKRRQYDGRKFGSHENNAWLVTVEISEDLIGTMQMYAGTVHVTRRTSST